MRDIKNPKEAVISDMRLHVAAANSYFDPGMLVTCRALDQASAMVKTEPKLIAEVLSPTTATYDRGLKFSRYRTLTSLEEYVLVDLDTRATDCYRKGADGLWVLHPFARGEAVELASVTLTLTAAQFPVQFLTTCGEIQRGGPEVAQDSVRGQVAMQAAPLKQTGIAAI